MLVHPHPKDIGLQHSDTQDPSLLFQQILEGCEEKHHMPEQQERCMTLATRVLNRNEWPQGAWGK